MRWTTSGGKSGNDRFDGGNSKNDNTTFKTCRNHDVIRGDVSTSTLSIDFVFPVKDGNNSISKISEVSYMYRKFFWKKWFTDLWNRKLEAFIPMQIIPQSFMTTWHIKLHTSTQIHPSSLFKFQTKKDTFSVNRCNVQLHMDNYKDHAKNINWWGSSYTLWYVTLKLISSLTFDMQYCNMQCCSNSQWNG